MLVVLGFGVHSRLLLRLPRGLVSELHSLWEWVSRLLRAVEPLGGRILCRQSLSRALALPLPRIPDGQGVESESYQYQETIIIGTVSRQSKEIETREDYSCDDVCPAIHRIVYRQG